MEQIAASPPLNLTKETAEIVSLNDGFDQPSCNKLVITHFYRFHIFKVIQFTCSATVNSQLPTVLLFSLHCHHV